jgi:tRNA pseudouridine38-40 synthase
VETATHAANDLPHRYVAGLVSYDGTDYHGFQVQAGAPTIQGALETALASFAQPESRVSGAGRTDTGVHARGQVVAVRVRWRHTVAALQNAWNAHLPPAIHLRRMVEAPEGFHPRFSALWRTYRYTVVQAAGAAPGPRRSPLTERYAWLVAQPLDWAAMQYAASCLVGEHDFATFGQAAQGESTVRRVCRAEWQQVVSSLPALGPDPEETWVLTIQANGFLRQMVRSLVGSLVMVGRGEWSVAEFAARSAAHERSLAAPPAPPQGLVLEQVDYPDQWALWSGAAP